MTYNESVNPHVTQEKVCKHIKGVFSLRQDVGKPEAYKFTKNIYTFPPHKKLGVGETELSCVIYAIDLPTHPTKEIAFLTAKLEGFMPDYEVANRRDCFAFFHYGFKAIENNLLHHHRINDITYSSLITDDHYFFQNVPYWRKDIWTEPNTDKNELRNCINLAYSRRASFYHNPTEEPLKLSTSPNHDPAYQLDPCCWVTIPVWYCKTGVYDKITYGGFGVAENTKQRAFPEERFTSLRNKLSYPWDWSLVKNAPFTTFNNLTCNIDSPNNISLDNPDNYHIKECIYVVFAPGHDMAGAKTSDLNYDNVGVQIEYYVED